MHYEWAVIEHYLDGTTWTHYFTTEQAAQRAVEDMKAAHAGRKYEIQAKK